MFGREPAAILGFISAGIALAVGFGLEVTDEQVGLIMAFVGAAIGLITRTQVVPVTKIEAHNLDPKTLRSIVVALLLGGTLFSAACAGNDNPNLSPVGEVAHDARGVIAATKTALAAIDAATVPGGIPKDVTVKIADFVQTKISPAGVALADALAAYKKSVTPESWRSLQGALLALNKLGREAIDLAPQGPTRDRIALLIDPVFAALFAITLPPPPTPSTSSDLAHWQVWQFELQRRATVAPAVTQ
jgi:hypothetical protein